MIKNLTYPKNPIIQNDTQYRHGLHTIVGIGEIINPISANQSTITPNLFGLLSLLILLSLFDSAGYRMIRRIIKISYLGLSNRFDIYVSKFYKSELSSRLLAPMAHAVVLIRSYINKIVKIVMDMGSFIRLMVLFGIVGLGGLIGLLSYLLFFWIVGFTFLTRYDISYLYNSLQSFKIKTAEQINKINQPNNYDENSI